MAEISTLNSYAVNDVLTSDIAKMNAYGVVDVKDASVSKMMAYVITDTALDVVDANAKGNFFLLFG